MTAMAFDPAGGGRDSPELAYRHGGWYGPSYQRPGRPIQLTDRRAAGTSSAHRRDNAPVVVDAGGGAGHGFGGTTIMRLKDNGIAVQPFNGASARSPAPKTARSVRQQAGRGRWKFRTKSSTPIRKAASGSPLPPDPELRADLAAADLTR